MTHKPHTGNLLVKQEQAEHDRKHDRQHRVCALCVMDETDPAISFDSFGVCNYHSQVEAASKNERFTGASGAVKLAETVAAIKTAGKGKEYDCVIGVSGGVDSSYLLCQALRLGLRPLAVHLDNGWNSELAVSNIEKILKPLKVNLFTHVIDWEEFRDLQLAFLKASVANAEIPSDHAIFASLYSVANKYSVKYILSGSNLATESILPRSWGYDFTDFKHLHAIHKQFGSGVLRSFPILRLSSYAYYVYVRQIKRVRLLNYLDYVRDEAIAYLKKEFDWQDYGGKHHESRFTRFFQAYILPRKFGFDKRRAHLSSMIVAGQLTRDRALEILEEEMYPEEELARDKDFVLKKLKLSETEFEEIMARPVKSFADYPSNVYLLTAIRRLRALF